MAGQRLIGRGWPRLADASGRLRHGLTLRAVSGEPKPQRNLLSTQAPVTSIAHAHASHALAATTLTLHHHLGRCRAARRGARRSAGPAA